MREEQATRAARSAEEGCSIPWQYTPQARLTQLYAYVSGAVLKNIDPLGLDDEAAGQCGVGSSCETVASAEDGSEVFTDGTTTLDAESKNAGELQSKPRDPGTTKYVQQSSSVGSGFPGGAIRVEAGLIEPVDGGKTYLFRDVDVSTNSGGLFLEAKLWEVGKRNGAGDTPDDGKSTDSKQLDAKFQVEIGSTPFGIGYAQEVDSEGNTNHSAEGGVGVVGVGRNFTRGENKVSFGGPISYEASGASLDDTHGKFTVGVSTKIGVIDWKKSRTVYDPEAD